MEKADPADLIMIGYEEALKMRRILEAMKEESQKHKIIKKSDDIRTYILTENKEGIIQQRGHHSVSASGREGGEDCQGDCSSL